MKLNLKAHGQIYPKKNHKDSKENQDVEKITDHVPTQELLPLHKLYIKIIKQNHCHVGPDIEKGITKNAAIMNHQFAIWGFRLLLSQVHLTPAFLQSERGFQTHLKSRVSPKTTACILIAWQLHTFPA